MGAGKPKDSVFNEPHLRSGTVVSHPENSVYNEVSHTGGATPYKDWLIAQREKTGVFYSWVVILACALVAGPFAVVGTFWGMGGSISSILALVVIGPTTEEIAKVMAILMLVERASYFVRSGGQILFCAMASGLVFSIIENFLYLYVYIPEPSPELVAWRWTVCVALHVGCSLVAGMGVVRIWGESVRKGRPPRLEKGIPFFVLAIVLHGGYNAFAIAYEGLLSPF